MVAGVAAATTSITVTVGRDGVTVHAESDDLPQRPPRPPPPPQDSFFLDVSPDAQKVEAGGTAVYSIHIVARRDVTISFSARNVTPGFVAYTPANESVRNGTNATTSMRVVAPHADATGYVTLVATATDTGESRAERVRLDSVTLTTLRVSIEPAEQTAGHGDNVTFRVTVHTTRNASVSLTIQNRTEGYDARLGSSRINPPAGGANSTTLFVRVLPNATSDGVFVIHAQAQDGAEAWGRAIVRLDGAWTTDPPAARPMP